MKPKIIIIGAGGHGKVVCDAIIAQDEYDLVGFIDASIAVGEVVTRGYKVIATQENIQTLNNLADYFIVAIGNNKIREKLYTLAKLTLKPAIVIHPSSIIGSGVLIGKGCVILANSVINAFSNVGDNSIINSGVVIDHECKIGSHIHLSIGTMVGSNSEIVNNHTTSIGEKIKSFSKIGLL